MRRLELRTMLLLCVAGGMLFTGVAHAALVEKDSADFANKYEADALPGADWTLSDSGPAGDVFAASGGELSYSTTEPAGSRFYNIGSGFFNPAPASDYTVEARLKVTAGGGDLPGTQIVVSNGSHHGYFAISTNSISVAVQGVYTIIASDLDNTDMHAYRIAYIASTDRFAMWRDETLISDNLDAWHSSYINHMFYGDPSNSVAGAASLDYMRADMTGAYAPVVPEPATMCLMAIGGAACLIRRKSVK